MKIEEFKNLTIAYKRATGAYGAQNEKLIRDFKSFLKSKHLFDSRTVLVGIALDDPAATPPEALRYDIGIIINKGIKISLNTRKIDDGKYAVYETAHTKQDIMNFWAKLPQLAADLPIDHTKPIIERYAMHKIANHICEFCVPLKEEYRPASI